MNEFKAKSTKGSLAIGNNGVVFDLGLTGIDEMTLEFKEGVWKITTGSKVGYLADGYQFGDTIHTGMNTGETPHSPSGSRLFKGRMPGRFKNTEKHLLNQALNEYEAALAKNRRNGHSVLPKWATVFNVQPSTVQGWMVKHRAVRKHPTSFGDLIKAAAME